MWPLSMKKATERNSPTRSTSTSCAVSVEFSDLLAYEKVRDQNRREALDRLCGKVDEANPYDADDSGEA
jgi:hypothetical protein